MPSPSFPFFFRTYSARIYSIDTNRVLACLHMPHPSPPVDDTRAHSFYREHAASSEQLEDVRLGSVEAFG